MTPLDEAQFIKAKEREAIEYIRTNGCYAPRPRLIDAVLKGEPLPQEPLEFG